MRRLPSFQSRVEHSGLTALNALLSPDCLLGIYSSSPFLQPARLLRRVQFCASPLPVAATSGEATGQTVVPHTTTTDPEQMVIQLREMANAQVARLPGVARLLATPPIFTGQQQQMAVGLPTAAHLGFATGHATHRFSVSLDRGLVDLLISQASQKTPRPGEARQLLL
ncbi:unnamed protein product [Protopolystoma xenopodis]|uniref:Uncharacterized protein n=1 Tax=Protopolystoma xenopodis TaxID=117903 RepID=A0A3S5FGV3_9PLAT|nr:unnamed protein product [Protopolystoma xenopodis]